MKKLLCLLLCLMLPVAAMAAPMRAMRDSVLSEAELATMRSWLDGVVRDALPLQYDSNTYVGAYVYSCVEDGFHSLTLSYPAEREAEFTLYAEFMRNSFVVSGQSNG